MKLLDGVKADATLSPCGTYRYALTRDWYPKDGGLSHALFIMLNPSTADADVDDPTIRRCQDFARRWGFNGVTVTNLFALRSTDPKALYSHPDPVGEANDDIIGTFAHAAGTGLVVAAWGTHGRLHNRAAKVLTRLSDVDVLCLGTTKSGFPRHPLYVAGDQLASVYREAAS